MMFKQSKLVNWCIIIMSIEVYHIRCMIFAHLPMTVIFIIHKTYQAKSYTHS